MTPPTRAELDAALALIAATNPDADVLRAGVADAYKVEQPEGPVLYLTADERAALTEGDRYVTWVVTFRAGQPVEVASFHSRACSTGDKTIPPETR